VEFLTRLNDLYFQLQRVDAVFRLNAAGRISGVTFIDYEQGIVANGSLLGWNFSANAFEQQFHAEAGDRRVYRNTTEQTLLKELHRPDQSIHPLDAVLE